MENEGKRKKEIITGKMSLRWSGKVGHYSRKECGEPLGGEGNGNRCRKRKRPLGGVGGGFSDVGCGCWDIVGGEK